MGEGLNRTEHERPKGQLTVAGAFDSVADRYEHYLDSPLGRLRHDLVWHYLESALRSREGPLRVLDAGAGTGRLARVLAEVGHSVCLLDPAPAMLALARERAKSLPQDVRARLRYVQAGLDSPDWVANEEYDLVLLHYLLEYVPDPRETLRIAVGALKHGGLLSVVFANRAAEPLRRAVLDGSAELVREALVGDTVPERLTGLPRRLLSPAEVGRWLNEARMTVVWQGGVRVFADYLRDLANPDSYANVLDLERTVGSLSPYRDIARYVHVVSRRKAH